jgi:hypothetical protein
MADHSLVIPGERMPNQHWPKRDQVTGIKGGVSNFVGLIYTPTSLYREDVLQYRRHMEQSWCISVIHFIFSGSAAQRGLWPPRSRGLVITHNDAPQSVGLLWTSDQLVAETSA